MIFFVELIHGFYGFDQNWQPTNLYLTAKQRELTYLVR